MGMEKLFSFFKKKWHAFRRAIAFILSLTLMITNCQIASFASENEYKTYLDGWRVDVAWNNLSYDYDWTAENESIKQPKMIITYRMDNAECDYPAGSLTFTVPGIGNINRNSVMKAYKLAADEADSEWNYTWDQVNDLYTFTNKFTVKTGQSVSGGFELLWNLDARDCADGFERMESPTFSVSDKGTIILNPLSFSFHSTRDRYRISLTRSNLTPEDYETSDKTMIWYRFDTLFNSDYLARGLYKSDYYMSIELPDGVEDSDVAAKVDGKNVRLTRNENGDLGFYPFKDKYGDISSYDKVEIGFTKQTLDGKNVTVNGHFDRLYNDEEEYVRTAGENENVDVSTTFTVSGYKFNSEGYIYSQYKYSKFERSYNSAAPSNYQDRFQATGLFNGKIVEFTLGGKAKRNYGDAVPAALSRRAKTRALNNSENSDDETEGVMKDTSLSDWNDLNWKENGLLSDSEGLDGATYGELYPNSISMEDYESIKEEDSENTEDIDTEDADTEEETSQDEGKKATASDIEKEKETEENESMDMLLMKPFRSLSMLQNAFSMKAFAAENEDAEYIEKATASTIQKTESITLNDAENDTEEDTTVNISEGAPKKAARPGGNDTGISNIKEDQEYSLVLGDDKLAVALNDGSMRALQDEEYDISYVYVPSTSPAYDYEIFGADTQDTYFDDYHLLASGKTDNGETVTLPEGVKAVFVRVNGIVGSYAIDDIRIGVRFHVDWNEDREKEIEKQVNRDGKVANFSYLRPLYVDDDGYEVNDCAMQATDYEENYGTELAERDINTYKEYLFRDYANVWLRNPTTVLNSSASISSMSGTAKEGYTATLKASGNIHGDNSGALQSFSLYMEVPTGMNVDLDETGASVTGSGTILDGAETDDFQSHATISERDNNGKHYIVADFDFSDEPLDTAKLTSISMTVPATLSYADFVSNGSYYRVGSYIMPHDGGLDKISGSQITADTYDLDENGSTEDFMAYAYDSVTVSDEATEWREYVSKYVKSSYSNGFTNDTVTRLYDSTDTADNKQKSDYQYRLDFGLGSSNAKNIVFFDNIEQGAEIALSGDDKDTMKTVKSEWQGDFQSVDTTYAEKLGLIPTVYYSTNKDQQQDLSASGWTTEKPSDPSAVKSIAVSLDTSKMSDGVMKTKQMAYIILNMRAPSDRNLVEKKAVNQYTVQYDAYRITNDFEKTYTLSSSETYVTLLDNVGKIVLQKVDGDNVLSVDANGVKKYATLTGAVIQVYDPDGKALFDKDGKEVNSLGRIVISNVRTGNYAWEELKAPAGYQKVAGKHAFTVDSINEITNIENKRIHGSVTLTKYDHDDSNHKVLSGAEYALYKSDGTRVTITKAGSSYSYAESGKDSTCVTGNNGTLTVSGLPWGNYYFLEVKAPVGYELNEEKVTFSIGKDQYDSLTDTIHTEVSQEDEQKTASIRLTKKDEEDGKRLKNAYYDVYVKKNNKWQKIYESVKTNAAGELIIDNLKFGSYQFIEVMPPVGYELDSTPIDTVLNASTAGSIVDLSQTDERKMGAVRLMKTSSIDDVPLSNAEFSLYKKADNPDDDVLIMRGLTTGADGTTDVVDDLTWGEYYFKETSAPTGYQISDEKIPVSVNAKNVSIVQTIKASNNRILGSVMLTKMDEATKSKKLSEAEFSLFRSDGTLVKSGLTTGTDGTFTVQALQWGSYYFEETKAPNGYGVSNAKVRFSVNADNCNVLQSVLCYDPVEQAEIKINKSINESYAPFGNATFIFKIKGTDINGVNHTWTRTITMKDGELEGSTRLTGIPVGKYTIEEQSVSRYGFSKLQAVKNVTINGDVATADLTSEIEAEVTFKNDLSQYEKFSHTTNAVNIVEANTKLTALKVTYTGQDTIQSDTEYAYTFTENDLNAVVFYDDGSSHVVYFSDLTLDPKTITGDNNTSGAGYVIHVSYTENGSTVTDDFSVNVKLQAPPKPFTVTYDANGGYFGTDTSKTSNAVTYQKEKQLIRKTSKTDNVKEDGSGYSGGYGDNATKTEVVTIPGAGALKVTITYQTESKIYDWVCMWEGAYPEYTAKNNYSSSKTGKLGGSNNTKTYIVTGDTVTFGFCSDSTSSNYFGYYAVVENALKAIDGAFTKPSHPVKVFVGWYTNAACTDGHEFSLANCESDTKVYAKWRDSVTTLKYGTSLSDALAAIAVDKATITAFKRSEVMPDIASMTDANIISIDNSDVPIYCWKEDTILKYWTKAEIINAQNLYDTFQGFKNIVDISGLSYWNTEHVNVMKCVFERCSSLTSLSALSSWNTKNVTNMERVFYACPSLTDIAALSLWNVGKVTDMSMMFFYCQSLKDLTPLSSWNTGNVTTMSGMFEECRSLTDLTPLSSWNTGNMKYMSSAFNCCSELTDLTPLSLWNTGNVTSMQAMFEGCSNLANLIGIEKWNTENLTSMNNMFRSCISLTNITALSSWNTEKVTDMACMFIYCKNLTDLSALSLWNTGKVTYMAYMFHGCNNLANLIPLSSWNTEKVTQMQGMFTDCTELTDLTPLSSWDTGNVIRMGSNSTGAGMFEGCRNLTNLTGLEKWNTANVISMERMFCLCKKLIDINTLSSWNTGNVTTMSDMFSNCSLTNLDALFSWNTENVTDMSSMFFNCKALTDSTGINDYDISKVTNFRQMFCYCPSHPTFTKRAGTWDSSGTFTPAA